MFRFFFSKSKKKKFNKSPNKKSIKSPHKKSIKSPNKNSSEKPQFFQLESIPIKKKYNINKIIKIKKRMYDNKQISKKEKTKLISYWIHEVLNPDIIPYYTFTQWFEQNYSSKKEAKCDISGVNDSNKLSNYIVIRNKITNIDIKIEKYSGSGTPPKYVLEFINLLLRKIGLKQIFCPDI